MCFLWIERDWYWRTTTTNVLHNPTNPSKTANLENFQLFYDPAHYQSQNPLQSNWYPNFSQPNRVDPNNRNSDNINPANPVHNSYRSSSLLNAYENPQWVDPDIHTPSFCQSTLYSFNPNTKPTQDLVSNFQDQNLTVIPTQLNNTDNVGPKQQAMMQAQARSQILRNYTTMPKFDVRTISMIGVMGLLPGLQLMIMEE